MGQPIILCSWLNAKLYLLRLSNALHFTSPHFTSLHLTSLHFSYSSHSSHAHHTSHANVVRVDAERLLDV